MNIAKYGGRIPMTNVSNETLAAVQELMDKHELSKSEAIRTILNNGLVYMAIYGTGIQEDDNE